MKTLISVLVGILVAYLMFFKFDAFVVNSVLDAIPQSADEWKPLLKIVLWIIMVCVTFGLTVMLAVLAGFLTRVILGDTPRRSGFMGTGPVRKSKFQQRLEEMAEKRKKV